MDLGGEALGSYKARQGGCTHIQVGDVDSRRKLISTSITTRPSFSINLNISSVSFRCKH
jgi:hypothetical protein